MCDHIDCRPFTETDSPSDPCNQDRCHIYYVHQHGSVHRHPDALFLGPQAENPTEKREATPNNHVKDGEDVKTDRDVENVGSAERKGQEKNKGSVRSHSLAKAFCGDDRLTLMRVNLYLRSKPILVLTITDNFPSFLNRSRRSQRLRMVLQAPLARSMTWYQNASKTFCLMLCPPSSKRSSRIFANIVNANRKFSGIIFFEKSSISMRASDMSIRFLHVNASLSVSCFDHAIQNKTDWRQYTR